jgi:hypothetical protein
MQIWCLEAGGNDEPGVLWAGTIPGGLFHSKDNDESWELIRSLWDRPERKNWFGGGYDDPGIHSPAYRAAYPLMMLACPVWYSDRAILFRALKPGVNKRQ